MTLFDIFSGGPSDVLANVGNSVLLVTLMSAQDLRRKNKQKMSESKFVMVAFEKLLSSVAGGLNFLRAFIGVMEEARKNKPVDNERT